MISYLLQSKRAFHIFIIKFRDERIFVSTCWFWRERKRKKKKKFQLQNVITWDFYLCPVWFRSYFLSLSLYRWSVENFLVSKRTKSIFCRFSFCFKLTEREIQFKQITKMNNIISKDFSSFCYSVDETGRRYLQHQQFLSFMAKCHWNDALFFQ